MTGGFYVFTQASRNQKLVASSSLRTYSLQEQSKIRPRPILPLARVGIPLLLLISPVHAKCYVIS